ncbi:glutamate receptor-like [Ixodes scapularis]
MEVENHLRVSSFNYAPYHVTTKLGHNVPVQGVCGEILTAIAQSMRMNYSIAFPTDSFWGLRKPDGNWTGIIGMLQRDEADLALSVINPTSEKYDVAVATESIVPIELVIMAGRLSRHESDIFGLIQIFSWQYAPYHVTTKLGHNVPVQGVCGEILTAIAQSMRMK